MFLSVLSFSLTRVSYFLPVYTVTLLNEFAGFLLWYLVVVRTTLLDTHSAKAPYVYKPLFNLHLLFVSFKVSLQYIHLWHSVEGYNRGVCNNSDLRLESAQRVCSVDGLLFESLGVVIVFKV
jgi:hypothetical protein